MIRNCLSFLNDENRFLYSITFPFLDPTISIKFSKIVIIYLIYFAFQLSHFETLLITKFQEYLNYGQFCSGDARGATTLPPNIWQISKPYSNQGGRFCPP